MVNGEQLFMCTKIGQALRKSSTPNNYKTICDGVRRYTCNDTGHKVEQVSNLNKYQRPQCPHKVFKSNKCRNIFYQWTHLYIRVFILESRLIIIINMIMFLFFPCFFEIFKIWIQFKSVCVVHFCSFTAEPGGSVCFSVSVFLLSVMTKV